MAHRRLTLTWDVLKYKCTEQGHSIVQRLTLTWDVLKCKSILTVKNRITD